MKRRILAVVCAVVLAAVRRSGAGRRVVLVGDLGVAAPAVDDRQGVGQR